MSRRPSPKQSIRPFLEKAFLLGLLTFGFWAAFSTQSEFLLFLYLYLALVIFSERIPSRFRAESRLLSRIAKLLAWTMFIVVIVPYLLTGFLSPLSTANIPLVPDVRLSIVSAQTSPTFGTSEASSGRTYLTVTVKVRSVWNAWGMEVSTRHLEFIAEDTFDPVRGFRDIPGFCGAATPVPINGSVICNLIFEIPASLSSGTLRFDDFEYVDEVEVNF